MRISDWSSDVCSSDLTYEKYKRELIELMETVRLNNLRIEQLVHQLYELNRKLTRSEGRLLRCALSAGVERGYFLEQYRSEKRRVGKECGRTGRSRWSTYL